MLWWQSDSLQPHVLTGTSAVSSSLQPQGLYSPWNSPGQNTGVGSLSLLRGIFPTQGLNPGVLHCRWILYQLSHKGSPRILEWIAYASSVDLPNPGINLGSPVLQADFLPAERPRTMISFLQTIIMEKETFPFDMFISSSFNGNWTVLEKASNYLSPSCPEVHSFLFDISCLSSDYFCIRLKGPLS